MILLLDAKQLEVKLKHLLSLLFEKKIDYVGGAGVVAKHIAAANCTPNLITILGEDELKNFVLEDLKETKLFLTV